jgi:hypothetical protein
MAQPLSAEDVRSALERALAALPEEDSRLPADIERTARRLRERLKRDLLPRLGGEHPTLLVGIAGPNNVGKSSLFNSLLGRQLSPARAEGGLTKQCLAAAHPSVWAGGMRDWISQRYDVVLVEHESEAKVTEPGPPGRLYLLRVPTAAPGVLVMDTPDFDSIYLGNRAAAEALLVTVDVVFFMVSRQTYQNAALVQFLKDAVGHGKPYVLLYNEAARAEVADEHLTKLALDVGAPPVARYFAGHQPAVEEGTKLLSMSPLPGTNLELSALIASASERNELKSAALKASLQDALQELAEVAVAERQSAAEPERLRSRLRHEWVVVGERAARKAVPADTLIVAFQDELDARSAFNRIVRRQVRRFASVLTFVGRKVRDSFVGEAPAGKKLVELSDAALRDGARQAIDALSHEVAAWRGDAEVAALLADTLGPRTLERLERPLAIPELIEHGDEQVLYRFCRELVARELAGSSREQAIQLATTLVYSLPVGAAGALTWVTGGVGHDAVVWVTAAVSTPVLEKLVDLLGAGIRDDVTRQWAEAHGKTLAGGLERELSAPLLARLDALVDAAHARAGRLDAERALLSEFVSRSR